MTSMIRLFNTSVGLTRSSVQRLFFVYAQSPHSINKVCSWVTHCGLFTSHQPCPVKCRPHYGTRFNGRVWQSFVVSDHVVKYFSPPTWRVEHMHLFYSLQYRYNVIVVLTFPSNLPRFFFLCNPSSTISSGITKSPRVVTHRPHLLAHRVRKSDPTKRRHGRLQPRVWDDGGEDRRGPQHTSDGQYHSAGPHQAWGADRRPQVSPQNLWIKYLELI